MEEKEERKEIKASMIVLGLICAILGLTGMVIMGIILFFKNISLPAFAPVLLGISGFASIVNFFLRDDDNKIRNFIVKPGNAIGGIVFILVACVIV